jgi:hypothetical protein
MSEEQISDGNDQLALAVQLFVTNVENTILTAMDETIVEVNDDQRQWAHAVAGRVFNNLSTAGFGFSLNLGPASSGN